MDSMQWAVIEEDACFVRRVLFTDTSIGACEDFLAEAWENGQEAVYAVVPLRDALETGYRPTEAAS